MILGGWKPALYMTGKWSSEPHLQPGLNGGGAVLSLRETRVWTSAKYWGVQLGQGTFILLGQIALQKEMSEYSVVAHIETMLY